jgi:hypothetical protein
MDELTIFDVVPSHGPEFKYFRLLDYLVQLVNHASRKTDQNNMPHPACAWIDT